MSTSSLHSRSRAKHAAVAQSADHVRHAHIMLIEALVCSAALVGVAASLLQHLG